MNALLPFVGPTYDEILAALRLNSVPVAPPRDTVTGRFVSQRDITRKQLEAFVSTADEDARRAARARAADRSTPLTDKQRGRG